MRKNIFILLMTASAFSLASCGKSEDKAPSGAVTETRMDDIDNIEGTINDDMINVDETTERAPLAKNADKKPQPSSSPSSNNDEAENTDDAEDNDGADTE